MNGQGIWEGLSSLIDLFQSMDTENKSSPAVGVLTPGSNITHSSGGQAAAST